MRMRRAVRSEGRAVSSRDERSEAETIETRWCAGPRIRGSAGLAGGSAGRMARGRVPLDAQGPGHRMAEALAALVCIIFPLS